MKKIFISLFVVLFVFSCSKNEEIKEGNNNSVSTWNIVKEENNNEKSMKDLWLSYSTDWENIYYNWEKLFLSWERKNIIIDYKNIKPLNYTYFKDLNYVYFRSPQDAQTFDIIENVDLNSFMVTSEKETFKAKDKNWEYLFGVLQDNNSDDVTIKIEDNNVVLYKNWVKKELTNDWFDNYNKETYQWSYIRYNLEKFNNFILVEKNTWVYDSDSFTEYFIIQNNSEKLIDLWKKIESKLWKKVLYKVWEKDNKISITFTITKNKNDELLYWWIYNPIYLTDDIIKKENIEFSSNNEAIIFIDL